VRKSPSPGRDCVTERQFHFVAAIALIFVAMRKSRSVAFQSQPSSVQRKMPGSSGTPRQSCPAEKPLQSQPGRRWLAGSLRMLRLSRQSVVGGQVCDISRFVIGVTRTVTPIWACDARHCTHLQRLLPNATRRFPPPWLETLMSGSRPKRHAMH
jgi:hypothetical protein